MNVPSQKAGLELIKLFGLFQTLTRGEDAVIIRIIGLPVSVNRARLATIQNDQPELCPASLKSTGDHADINSMAFPVSILPNQQLQLLFERKCQTVA